jgi:hypothetical protein
MLYVTQQRNTLLFQSLPSIGAQCSQPMTTNTPKAVLPNASSSGSHCMGHAAAAQVAQRAVTARTRCAVCGTLHDACSQLTNNAHTCNAAKTALRSSISRLALLVRNWAIATRLQAINELACMPCCTHAAAVIGRSGQETSTHYDAAKLLM